MTLKKLFVYSVLQWVILALLKIWFFNSQIFSNYGLQELVFWAAVAAVAAAIVRRLGVLNFLEAFFLIIAWFLGDLLFDLLATSIYTGLSIFYNPAYWLGYAALAVAIIFFHKKRHIQVRKELHAKHYGHH